MQDQRLHQKKFPTILSSVSTFEVEFMNVKGFMAAITLPLMSV